MSPAQSPKASLVQREVAKPKVLSEGLLPTLFFAGSYNPPVTTFGDDSPLCTRGPFCGPSRRRPLQSAMVRSPSL